jgi:tRNA-dihydrouridine synthase
VKFRAGWDENELVFRELAKTAEGCGLDAVAMHARTRQQGYSGQAQWQWIAELKSLVSIPVIGNGDIRTPEDARAMVAETRCDGVMIGRAAASNPWIFRQISQFTSSGQYEVPSREDRYEMIGRYFRMLVEEGFPDAPGKMKQFASWFTHGVENGAKLRKAIYESKSAAQIVDAVDAFFTQPETGREEGGCNSGELTTVVGKDEAGR